MIPRILVLCFLPAIFLQAKPPNLVVLLVDDLGWTDLGCFGSDYYETPELDKLCASGMKFTRGYAACTVCSPTRASLLTGKYPPRTGITNWISGPDMRLRHEEVTLAEALRDGGYATGHVGKWHLAPRGDKAVADYYPLKQGFDVNIGGNHWGAPGSYYYPFSSKKKVLEFLPPAKEGDYLTDVLTDAAIGWVDSVSADKPFFLNVWYYNVHTPIQGRKDLVAYFEAKPKGARHKNAAYAAMLKSVDESVGRLVAALKENGRLDNTVFVFTGDNGGLAKPTNNAPLREGKGSEYEGGVREPTFVVWPGVTIPGSVCEEPVITCDIYPTLLEMAGLEGDATHNETVDGVSLVPLLNHKATSLKRQALYWHYPHTHGGGSKKYGAVLAGDWRLVEQYSTGELELYNLKNDIGETTNLANAEPVKTAELAGLLAEWRIDVGAEMSKPTTYKR